MKFVTADPVNSHRDVYVIELQKYDRHSERVEVKELVCATLEEADGATRVLDLMVDWGIYNPNYKVFWYDQHGVKHCTKPLDVESKPQGKQNR